MENHTYLVAELDEPIVGMIAIKNNEITKLYVKPENHRTGYRKNAL